MKQQVRKATRKDLSAIQSIVRHTIDMNYRVFLGDKKVNMFISGPSDDYLTGRLEDMYVLTVNDAVKGLSVIKGNMIDLMMMRHEDHRKGWGSKLILAMEELLFEKHDEIRVESFKNNHKTNQFYLKNGWKNVGAEFDEAAGENIYIFIKKR